MASVEPPDIWYKLKMPRDVIDEGHLSALQLESITYSCQQHDQGRFPYDVHRVGYHKVTKATYSICRKRGVVQKCETLRTSYANDPSQFLEDGNRAGFLIGDGAGVGKGRTIAGKLLT